MTDTGYIYIMTNLLGVKGAMAGPRYFKYKGEWLNDVRIRLGV